MIVLKILGIVLASVPALVLLVILLVCLIKVTVMGEADSEHFWLTVKVLFVKLRLPKEKTPGEPQPAPEKEKKKKEKKPKAEAPKKKKKGWIFDRWYMPSPMELVRMVGRLLNRIPKLIGHIRIHHLRLSVVCGGSDPAELAMSYGSLCSAVYPILGYLETRAQVDKDAMDIDLRCDFDTEDTKTEFAFNISLRGVHAIWMLIRVLVH